MSGQTNGPAHAQARPPHPPARLRLGAAVAFLGPGLWLFTGDLRSFWVLGWMWVGASGLA